MNALDSPLEALALNYLSYGFLTAVNSMWAWVAVITAAVSFWSIRALSSQPVLSAEPRSRSQDAASTSSATPKVAEKTAAAEPTTVSTTRLSSAPITSMMSCGNVLESEGGTKTKFSMYCKEHDFREDDDGGKMEDNGGDSEDYGWGGLLVREKLGGWCDDWERMMVVRMGDLGWYRWQDTTVLDGSVVRLWDSCRRRHAAALMVHGGGAW